MKIVNIDTIQNSEKDFIDAINAELDWVAIEKMILEKHKLQLQDEVSYKQGDIVIHDNQIAYRLDFDITVSLSLTFNREGECVHIETPDGQEVMEDIQTENLPLEPRAIDESSSSHGDADYDSDFSPASTPDTQSDFSSDSEVD